MTAINLEQYSSILQVFNESCARYTDRVAFTCMGRNLSFAKLEEKSRHFAAYLQQHTDLKPGDRIAILLPNTLMFPVAVFGALRAGLIVVNTNPLYSEREMEHQFNDSGARAIVVLANMAHSVERILPLTHLKHVIVTELGDMHSPFKRFMINKVVRYVKKMVPAYDMPHAVTMGDVMRKGRKAAFTEHVAQLDDVAALQYTGGTTGVAKGAMLTHRNLVANMLQIDQVIAHLFEGDKPIDAVIAPLPMYHIYTFTVNCMFLLTRGVSSVLIPNPRDLPNFVKELKRVKYSGFIGLNTLFMALCNREDFRQLDFSNLRLTISGGMALTAAAAERWKEVTGCDILEGYGLTETSPVATLNPPGKLQIGTIGLPVPDTELKILDEEGNELPVGEPGELCVRGPQVMKGYWQRPDETAKVLSADGWFRTGDVALVQEDGYVRIVDRKKDMINVSGFNVYPNEIEEVLLSHPDVLEAAAVGVSDPKSGEAVKAFVVSRNKALDVKDLRRWCKERLTAYKVPRHIEFRDELPKTNVGKVLRRQLRDEPSAS